MIAKDLMKTSFIKVDKEDTISKLIGKFRLSHKTEAVVLDKKKFIGIVSKKKMLKSRVNVSEAKVRHLVWKVAVLNGEEGIAKAAKLMVASDVHMLPVVKKGIVEGVVYAIDVAKQLDPALKEKRISDVVRKHITAFDRTTEIGKVINIMRLKNIHRAPIVSSRRKLVGIVSIIDLLLKYSIFPAKRPGGKNIREAKSSTEKERDLVCLPIINEASMDVVTARKEDRIKTAIMLMEKNKISDVVIVDDYHEPVAIITVRDILKLF